MGPETPCRAGEESMLFRTPKNENIPVEIGSIKKYPEKEPIRINIPDKIEKLRRKIRFPNGTEKTDGTERIDRTEEINKEENDVDEVNYHIKPPSKIGRKTGILLTKALIFLMGTNIGSSLFAKEKPVEFSKAKVESSSTLKFPARSGETLEIGEDGGGYDSDGGQVQEKESKNEITQAIENIKINFSQKYLKIFEKIAKKIEEKNKEKAPNRISDDVEMEVLGLAKRMKKIIDLFNNNREHKEKFGSLDKQLENIDPDDFVPSPSPPEMKGAKVENIIEIQGGFGKLKYIKRCTYENSYGNKVIVYNVDIEGMPARDNGWHELEGFSDGTRNVIEATLKFGKDIKDAEKMKRP